MAQIVEENSDTLQLQPQTTTGFMENFARVMNDENDAGLSSAAAYYAARNGTEPFEEPVPEDELPLGITPTIHMSGFYLATLERTGIESFEDLSGSDFAYLHRGSATNPINEYVFEEGGLDGEINTEYLGFTDQRSALLEDRIDAWQPLLFDQYYHNGAHVEVYEQEGDFVHIPIPDDVIDATMDRVTGGWDYLEVDADTVDDITINNGPLDYFFTPSQLYVGQDMDEDVVYELTEILVEQQDALTDGNRIFHTYGWGDAPEESPIDERYEFLGIENDHLHPAAIDYYEDAGIEYPQ
ncbi:TAXI family TRAP transporter solute-binding subunit [Natronorubrum sp. JWXQ-INN-674]|uniref:TAXI family TRAP transporter solute-binding subunit n=2 Tax=Natronorubrum halalkaliphilum TaxID=2691917 RepID=A0A6B0VR95_9EURY|nr:TAXI family TRAP transporter solute-binding subunit [Natronorubrum halalkaliphilum]